MGGEDGRSTGNLGPDRDGCWAGGAFSCSMDGPAFGDVGAEGRVRAAGSWRLAGWRRGRAGIGWKFVESLGVCFGVDAQPTFMQKRRSSSRCGGWIGRKGAKLTECVLGFMAERGCSGCQTHLGCFDCTSISFGWLSLFRTSTFPTISGFLTSFRFLCTVWSREIPWFGQQTHLLIAKKPI